MLTFYNAHPVLCACRSRPWGWLVPFLFVWSLGMAVRVFAAAGEGGTGIIPPASRILPTRVEYAFSPKSPIQNKDLIRVTGIRLFREDGKSMYYLQVVNKTQDPVSFDGEVLFYDRHGRVIYHRRPGEGSGAIS